MLNHWLEWDKWVLTNFHHDRQWFNTLIPLSHETAAMTVDCISRLCAPVRLVLRYTTVDIHGRDRRYEWDSKIFGNSTPDPYYGAGTPPYNPCLLWGGMCESGLVVVMETVLLHGDRLTGQQSGRRLQFSARLSRDCQLKWTYISVWLVRSHHAQCAFLPHRHASMQSFLTLSHWMTVSNKAYSIIWTCIQRTRSSKRVTTGSCQTAVRDGNRSNRTNQTSTLVII